MRPRDVILFATVIALIAIGGVIFLPNPRVSPAGAPLVIPTPTTVHPLPPPVLKACRPPAQRLACNAYWNAVAHYPANNAKDARKVRRLLRIWQSERHGG